MQARQDLTDRLALARRRARAAGGDALFLHHEAAAELEERLGEVNRTFTAPAVITGFPDLWRDLRPGARIVGDDETLALDPGAHDLVIHAMAMHWANDPVGQIIQARRALAPDGLFLAVLPGGRTLAELREVLSRAEAEVMDGLSPRVAPMGEVRDLGGLLQRAGLAMPVADTVRLSATYSGIFDLMRDLRAMGETNVLAARDRRTPPRALFVRAAELYSELYPAGDGRIGATYELVFLSGWAPDENQPQPLRPGSATTRLAEALNTDEIPARDTPPRRDD